MFLGQFRADCLIPSGLKSALGLFLGQFWGNRCDGEAVALDVQEGIHHHHAALDYDELGLKLHDSLVGKLYQKGLVVPSESLRIIWASCSRRTGVPETGRRQR